MKTVAWRLNLPEDLHRRVKALAAFQGVTMEALILRLLAEGVGEELPKAMAS